MDCSVYLVRLKKCLDRWRSLFLFYFFQIPEYYYCENKNSLVSSRENRAKGSKSILRLSILNGNSSRASHAGFNGGPESLKPLCLVHHEGFKDIHPLTFFMFQIYPCLVYDKCTQHVDTNIWE